MSGRRRSRHSQQGGARNTPQTQPATSWRSEPEEQRLAGRISGSPPRKRPRNQFGRQQRQQHGASHSQPKLQSPVATEMSGVASQSSSSSMPEIPGFYFDVEKNRYFKIAADKIATSSNPYTVLKLKQKEDARIRKAERQKFDDQCKSTVHPRKRHGFTYSHPNASLFLSDREQGGLCRRSSEAWKSCGWETMIRYLRHCSTYKNAGGRTAGDGFVIGAGHIVDFQIHPTEPHVCVARADNSIRVFEYEDFAKQPDSEASQGFTLSHDLSSEISSVRYLGNVNGQPCVAAAYLNGGNRRGGVFKIYPYEKVDFGEGSGTAFLRRPIISEYHGGKNSAIHSCAVTKEGDHHFVALGESKGVFSVFNPFDGNVGTRRGPGCKLFEQSDILSLSFVDQAKSLLVGCRNGNVHLCDPRIGNRPCAASFRGGVALSDVHDLGDQRFIGMHVDGEMLLWDKRFESRPYMILRDGISDIFTHNMSINMERNIVMSGGRDGYIHGWSLRTGKQILQRQVAAAGQAIRRVQFAADWGSSRNIDDSTSHGIAAIDKFWLSNDSELQLWALSDQM